MQVKSSATESSITDERRVSALDPLGEAGYKSAGEALGAIRERLDDSELLDIVKVRSAGFSVPMNLDDL